MTKAHTPLEALERAIAIVGSAEELATITQTPKTTVSSWRHKSKMVGAKKAVAVEMATGGKVTRYELRPDIFGGAA